MRLKRLFVNYWFLIVVGILSFGAFLPLFRIGFFTMHDDTQPTRVYQMAKALKDGQFPVRWVEDLGYGFGYPIFNFYAPLPYYIGGFFDLVGFSSLVATKIMFGLGIFLSGITMYFLGQKIWGQWGGMICGLFYIYAPYHAVDVYVRGAVGEFWAMVFLPLVFLGIYKIFKNERRGILIGVLGFAGVVLSHNLTALMLIPFLGLGVFSLFILSRDKKRFLISVFKFLILSLGFSAFYWLPALVEMGETKVFAQLGGGADWRDHFVFLDQLWKNLWGFGGSAPGRVDGMSFSVGKIHLLMVGVALMGAIFWKKKKNWFGIGGFLLAIFLTTKYSYVFWQLIPQMAFVQYPWRFLIFAVFFSSLLAGFISKLSLKSVVLYRSIVIGVLILLLLVNARRFWPQEQTSIDYFKPMNVKWVVSNISNEYLPKGFPVPKKESEVAWEKLVILSGDVKIRNEDFKSHKYFFEIDSLGQSEILVNTAYFSGWKVWIDDEEILPEIYEGKIKLAFLDGQHQVRLKFTNTYIRILANIISLITIIVYIFVVRKKRI